MPSFGSEISTGNITENWLFKLANDNSGFLYFAFSDVTDSGNFYHGVILNKPSIRESIDLSNSTSKTSNVSISMPDFTYQGNPISEELFGGSNHYINQVVLVYSKVGSATTQIGSFRLTDISSDSGKISISMASHRPWDFIDFPQAKTTSSNVYVPYVIGEFSANDSYYDTPSFCDTKLYPAPVIGVDTKVFRTLMPRAYSSGSDAHLNIWHGGDVFLPLQSLTGSKTDTTTTLENEDAIETPTTRFANGWVYGHESRNPDGTGTELDNTYRAFDSDDDTYSTISVTGGGNYLLGMATIPEKWSTHSIRKISISHKYSLNADFNLYIYVGNSLNTSGAITFVANTLLTTTIDVSGIVKVGQQWTMLYIKTLGGSGTLSVQNVKTNIHTAFDSSDEDELKRLGEIKYLYSGGNGFTHAITGLSGTITEIHEAHLDLLNRFAGLDVATNPATNIDGWSDLETSKDWAIRWWQLEPIELKKALEKLQYEGGFIFRYKADGSPQYIHIKDSHTADETLTKADLSGVSVKPSSFSELITQIDVNYERHPAENKYMTSQTSTNATARTNWNIQAKENIMKVDLDAYVSPTIPATPSTNPNDDFYTYYDNIFGDIKLIVSGTIVNPKYYNLEVGKVLAFSDMYPIKAFNTSWSGLKFMITGLTRTAGTLKFEAREI